MSAFPHTVPADENRRTATYVFGGMSLRDYFAGQAMTCWTQRPATPAEEIAKKAYALADAMLKERAR